LFLRRCRCASAAGLFCSSIVLLLLLLAGSPSHADNPPPGDRPTPERSTSSKNSQVDPLPEWARSRLGTNRWRTAGPVSSLAVAKDGKLIAAVAGKRVSLWEAATGKEIRCLEGIQNGCRALALSPDGKLLAAVDDYAPAHVWEVSTGREILQLAGHVSPMYAVAFSPDGKVLATGGGVGNDKKFCLWDVASGLKLHEVMRYTDGLWLGIVGALSFSPDSKLIAAQTEWGQAGVWSVETGLQVAKLVGPQQVVLANIAFAADGKRVYVFQGTQARTFALPAYTEGPHRNVPVAHDHAWGSLLFRPDQKMLLTGGRVVRFWEWDSLKELRPFGDKAPSGRVLAFAPEGKVLAVGGNDSAIQLWNLADGKELNPTPGHRQPVCGVAFSPGGRSLGSLDAGGRLHLWDAQSGKVLRTIEAEEVHASFLSGPIFRPIGLMHGVHCGVAYTPSGRWLVTSMLGIRVWDAASGQKRLQLPFRQPCSVAVASDDKLLAVSGWDRSKREYALCLWNMVSNTEVRRFAGHKDPLQQYSRPIRALALSADDKLLASAATDGTILVWDVTSGEVKQQLIGESGQAHSLAFSPEGRWLVAAGTDGALRQWSLRSGFCLRRLPGHEGPVTALAMTPDGRLIVSGGEDRTIIVWEAATGTRIRQLKGHQAAVTSLALTADAKTLASASQDTTVVTWDLTGGSGAGEPGDLTPPALERLWTALADADAAKAERAHWSLVRSPQASVKYLATRLQPVVPPDAKRVALLIERIDSDVYRLRAEAESELRKLGPLVEKALRQRLEQVVSAEMRNRLERLLNELGDRSFPAATELQEHRAVEVLAGIGTAEAQQYLEALARGAAGAGRTERAALALERLRPKGVR
jgi:WD40 repeat protein